MKRRDFLKAAAGLPLFAAVPARARPADPGVFRFGFGSCLEQDREQPIWRAIAALKPDLFAMIGDNIYADTEDMSVMAAKYAQLGANPDFAGFRRRVPVVATWDDHDYGCNDSGREYPKKEESKKLMLDFFREPARSPRRSRGGVYTSYLLGPPGRRVQVILLDLRWFRSELVWRDEDQKGFVPNPDPSAVLLGEEQWRWLERELARPADVRLLASSIQLTAAGHQWEKWSNFPHELERLTALVDRLGVANLVVVSGDMHYGELSSLRTPGGIELAELTSSGLNYFESSDGIPNANRSAVYDAGINFGWVTVEWGAPAPRVTLELRDGDGRAVLRRAVRIGAQ